MFLRLRDMSWVDCFEGNSSEVAGIQEASYAEQTTFKLK